MEKKSIQHMNFILIIKIKFCKIEEALFLRNHSAIFRFFIDRKNQLLYNLTKPATALKYTDEEFEITFIIKEFGMYFRNAKKYQMRKKEV